jgi:hypothetical protein
MLKDNFDSNAVRVVKNTILCMSSLVHFENKNILFFLLCKHVLAHFNAGVVCVYVVECKFRSREAGS